VLALSAAASWDALPARLLDYLRAEVEEVLELDGGELEGTSRPLPQMLLSELGVDSLAAMDLRDRLRKQLGVEVSVERLLGESTVQGLIEMLQEQLILRHLSDSAAAPQSQDRETFVL
jgi:acyl carrier protein